MKKITKNITTGTLVVTSLLSNVATIGAEEVKDYIDYSVKSDKEYCSYSVGNETPQIVIRAGEYDGKPGKRAYINPNEINVPSDIPIHQDEHGYYIQEFDINKKLATAIYKKLLNKGVSAQLHLASSKKEDLNSAGRKARRTGADMYLSVHHNSYKEDSSGMFFMCNEGEHQDALISQRLANSVKGSSVPMLDNRLNTNGYIGELNETSSMINILGEFGFFSNPKELEIIMSDEQVEFISERVANEIYQILQEVK